MKDEELAQMALEHAAVSKEHHTPAGFTLKNFLTFVGITVLIMIVGQFTPGIPDEDIMNIIISLAYVYFFGVRPQNKNK